MQVDRPPSSIPTDTEKHAEESQPLDEGWLEAALNLIELTGVTDEDLIDNSLEAAIRLTGSRIGYLHFVSEDRERSRLCTRTNGLLHEYNTDKTSPYTLGETNVWTDCLLTRKPVIDNAYQNPSIKADYPEGRIHITRHMSIPIHDDEKIVAIAGVGNKAEQYDQSDIRRLSLFMNSMWCILKRNRMQERTEILVAELQKVLANSKSLSGLVPICSNCKRIRDDQGCWNQLESYLQAHTDADFTHGICPECTRQLYPYVNIGK
ncbi:MAG: GAF domain-containing protein [Fidelibacterota bacterium]|nr:MAG: GAF domain-containing protein [Candidatus Neomarinimicrobiota bacterium]